MIVLNEHGGYGASGSAPTAIGVLEKYFELKRQDEAAATGVASVTGGSEKKELRDPHPVGEGTDTSLVRTAGETH